MGSGWSLNHNTLRFQIAVLSKITARINIINIGRYCAVKMKRWSRSCEGWIMRQWEKRGGGKCETKAGAVEHYAKQWTLHSFHRIYKLKKKSTWIYTNINRKWFGKLGNFQEKNGPGVCTLRCDVQYNAILMRMQFCLASEQMQSIYIWMCDFVYMIFFIYFLSARCKTVNSPECNTISCNSHRSGVTIPLSRTVQI